MSKTHQQPPMKVYADVTDARTRRVMSIDFSEVVNFPHFDELTRDTLQRVLRNADLYAAASLPNRSDIRARILTVLGIADDLSAVNVRLRVVDAASAVAPRQAPMSPDALSALKRLRVNVPVVAQASPHETGTCRLIVDTYATSVGHTTIVTGRGAPDDSDPNKPDENRDAVAICERPTGEVLEAAFDGVGYGEPGVAEVARVGAEHAVRGSDVTNGETLAQQAIAELVLQSKGTVSPNAVTCGSLVKHTRMRDNKYLEEVGTCGDTGVAAYQIEGGRVRLVFETQEQNFFTMVDSIAKELLVKARSSYQDIVYGRPDPAFEGRLLKLVTELLAREKNDDAKLTLKMQYIALERLFRKKREILNKPGFNAQSWMPEMIELMEQGKHVILNSLGAAGTPRESMFVRQKFIAMPGTVVITATDGLRDVMNSSAVRTCIERAVRAGAKTSEELARAVMEELEHQIIQNGGKRDNIGFTVTILK